MPRILSDSASKLPAASGGKVLDPQLAACHYQTLGIGKEAVQSMIMLWSLPLTNALASDNGRQPSPAILPPTRLSSMFLS